MSAYKIDRMLKARDRTMMVKMAYKPGIRGTDMLRWAKSKGYRLPKASFYRWKKSLSGLTPRQATELAKALQIVLDQALSLRSLMLQHLPEPEAKAMEIKFNDTLHLEMQTAKSSSHSNRR